MSSKVYTLPVKVVPGASSSAISGWLGNKLKIRISAAPENGKANSALIKLLADRLDINSQSLEITLGHTSAHKIVKITGLSQQDIDRTFGLP